MSAVSVSKVMGAILTRLAPHEIAICGVSGQNSQQMTSIDEKDRQILRILSRDGRISNLALAERVSLSPSAALRRVQALEAAGVISGYRAVLDPGRLGVGFVAYLAVGLKSHTKPEQEAFERAMATAAEVRECHNVTGTVEYLLRVEAADLPSYKRFHTDILGALPQVATITTYVVMGTPKDERA
jgi:Lrp/AsnC family leucine-responsive transcriptional regulator